MTVTVAHPELGVLQWLILVPVAAAAAVVVAEIGPEEIREAVTAAAVLDLLSLPTSGGTTDVAHFAEIDADGLVVQVLVVPDEQQHRGQEYLATECFKGVLVDGKIERRPFGGTWVQTSYNTRHGHHRTGGTPLRKNYAHPGYTYDSVRDAFIPPKPYPSWLLNEDICDWYPPIPRPSTPPAAGMKYKWDEATVSWLQVPRTLPQPSA